MTVRWVILQTINRLAVFAQSALKVEQADWAEWRSRSVSPTPVLLFVGLIRVNDPNLLHSCQSRIDGNRSGKAEMLEIS